MQWKPNVVVAAIIERDGKFLVIEETADGQAVLNQPAGHLDQGETLTQAVCREVLEETTWHFEPQGVVGIYLLPKPDSDITYMRVCFFGRATHHESDHHLDHGIIQALWLTREELLDLRHKHRSDLVLKCLDDYLTGKRYPLDLLHHIAADKP